MTSAERAAQVLAVVPCGAPLRIAIIARLAKTNYDIAQRYLRTLARQGVVLVRRETLREFYDRRAAMPRHAPGRKGTKRALLYWRVPV